MPLLRRFPPVLALVAAVLGLGSRAAVAAGSAEGLAEYQIKGAYLYKFTKYVQWPEAAFRDASSPFVIAVVDKEGAAAAQIAELLRGKSAGDRPIRVLRVDDGSIDFACQLVFVSRSAAGEWPALRTALAGKPVLLVGESPGFAEHGGAINFVTEDGQVRFEINPSRAGQGGLTVSGNLAAVARIVRDRTEN